MERGIAVKIIIVLLKFLMKMIITITASKAPIEPSFEKVGLDSHEVKARVPSYGYTGHVLHRFFFFFLK